MQQWLPLMVTSVVTIIASQGFWAWLQRKTGAKDAYQKMMIALVYDKIITLGLGYIERGWITKDEYEDFRNTLYDPYKAAGGNGVAERIMEEVSHLPFRSPGKYAEIVQIDKLRRQESS